MKFAVRVLALMTVTASTACSTGRAATPIERPALDVPPPPPRVIVPLPPPEPAAHEPEAPPTKPPRPRPQPPRETAKPDPPDPALVAPAIPPATPPPQLRMPDTGDAAAASRQVRDIIERTRRTLSSTDYGRLSNVRKKAYEDAKLFAEQAEDALKASNVVFAKELAEKAERLARELQSR